MYTLTLEGYPIILDRKTSRKFIDNHVLNFLPQRWVLLHCTAKGYWQAWTNEGEKGSQYCLAGSKWLSLLLPEMTKYLRKHNMYRKKEVKSLGFWCKYPKEGLYNGQH